jgi:hypothetical protein
MGPIVFDKNRIAYCCVANKSEKKKRRKLDKKILCIRSREMLEEALTDSFRQYNHPDLITFQEVLGINYDAYFLSNVLI